MYIPEIIEIKEHLDRLKRDDFIAEWELPYENLLTRRSAAIFFLSPGPYPGYDFWLEFEKYDNFSMRLNTEKKLSNLIFRFTFSKEEKEQNSRVTPESLKYAS
jgi:hypothetical protein